MKTPGLILVAMGLALLAPVAFGATRTSANYSLTTETGDAGGPPRQQRQLRQRR